MTFVRVLVKGTGAGAGAVPEFGGLQAEALARASRDDYRRWLSTASFDLERPLHGDSVIRQFPT
jgi:hypothetical protein